MRLSVVKHVPFESAANIAAWARARGHVVVEHELSLGPALPACGEFDLLVLMGGPMSASDEREYPWLVAEKTLVRQALAAGKKIIGVCLGAQVIASALGARVAPMGYREIGWFPVRATPEGKNHPWVRDLDGIVAFHWHGEVFEIPQGAVHLLGSEACATQAFAIGDHTLGLQCHFEVDAASVNLMVAHGRRELSEGGAWVQPEDALNVDAKTLQRLRAACFGLLDRFASKTS